MTTEISQAFPGTQQTKSPGTASVPLFLLVYTRVLGWLLFPALSFTQHSRAE